MSKNKKLEKALKNNWLDAVDFVFKGERYYWTKKDALRDKETRKRRLKLLWLLLFVLSLFYANNVNRISLFNSEEGPVLKTNIKEGVSSLNKKKPEVKKMNIRINEKPVEKKNINETENEENKKTKAESIEKKNIDKKEVKKKVLSTNKETKNVEKKKVPVIKEINEIKVSGRTFKKNGSLFLSSIVNSLEDHGGLENLKRFLQESEIVKNKYKIRLFSKDFINSNKAVAKRVINSGLYLCVIDGSYGYVKKTGSGIKYKMLVKSTLRKFQSIIKVQFFLEEI